MHLSDFKLCFNVLCYSEDLLLSTINAITRTHDNVVRLMFSNYMKLDYFTIDFYHASRMDSIQRDMAV